MTFGFYVKAHCKCKFQQNLSSNSVCPIQQCINTAIEQQKPMQFLVQFSQNIDATYKTNL